MSYPEKNLKAIVFGPFTVEVSRGALMRGKEEVHLRPLTKRFLGELAKQPNALVPREHLRHVIWDGRVVEWEMGLHRLARELREALGEDARNPVHVHTIPKQGYMLKAREIPAGASVGRRAFSRAKWFAAGTVAFPAAFLGFCVYIGLTAP